MYPHPNQDRIVAILSAAQPNSNLLAKADKAAQYNVVAQQQREQKLYDALRDPFTQERITNIRQLNELIHRLDSDLDYGFGALLPNAAGGVEEYLSQKYNLRLVESSKFSETEQEAIKNYIEQNLARPAIDILRERGYDFANSYGNAAVNAIVTAMSYINLNTGNLYIFSSGSEYRSNRSRFLNMNASGPLADNLPDGAKVGNIRFMYNILKDKQGGVKIKLDFSTDGIAKDFKIDGDLNSLTDATRKALLDWARSIDNGALLDSSRQSKAPLNPGGGTKAPGSATPEEWKRDVYDAVNMCLGFKYRNLMQLNSGEIDSLFNKYNIGTEIALGRQLVNLRGFLGELRCILMLDAICPGATSKLTGTLKVDLATKLSRKGQSAPTDLLVQLIEGLNIGIQIKNTSDLNSYTWGNYRSSKGMPVPSFYAERLQENITDNERDFFGAYVYNQPINDSSYQEIYASFNGVFELFYYVYTKLAMYIIRQETELSEDSPLSGNLKNDFFIMNDSIIPTSALYQAMNDSSGLINSSFEFSTSSTGYYTPQNPIPSNYMNYASQMLITYSIELQYAKLLQSAYNMV